MFEFMKGFEGIFLVGVEEMVQGVGVEVVFLFLRRVDFVSVLRVGKCVEIVFFQFFGEGIKLNLKVLDGIKLVGVYLGERKDK